MPHHPPTVAWLLLILLSAAPAVQCADIRVAVASNFMPTARTLVARFLQQTDDQVTLIGGSTGKHYAQIINGAPFDVFLAADVDRPQRLEQAGRAVPGSRFTYAVGQLVLWSADPERVDSGGQVLQGGTFRHLALANPRLAPYGRAARQVLQHLGRWDALQPRLVRGENVLQAFHFVSSGNAELGFVARAQLNGPDTAAAGSAWLIPPALHDPIEQQATMIRDSELARVFLRFLRGDDALNIIRNDGYATR